MQNFDEFGKHGIDCDNARGICTPVADEILCNGHGLGLVLGDIIHDAAGRCVSKRTLRPPDVASECKCECKCKCEYEYIYKYEYNYTVEFVGGGVVTDGNGF